MKAAITVSFGAVYGGGEMPKKEEVKEMAESMK
jgi:hypothetical protein